MKVVKANGVTPAVGICFWCGKDTNVYAMHGPTLIDATVPGRCFAGYEPCSTCRESMNHGVTVMEAAERPTFPGQPMLGNKYPTGRWMVFELDVARRIFISGAMEIIRKADNKCMLGQASYEQLHAAQK